MRYFLVDIELVTSRGGSFQNPSTVRMREITFMIYEGRTLVKTESYQLHASRKRGYTTPNKIFFRYLRGVMATCDVFVSHNVKHDLQWLNHFILSSNCSPVNFRRTICTMSETVFFCSIQGNNGKFYKYPKLCELYRKLFKKPLLGAHSSLGDCVALSECFWELVKKEVLVI